MILKQDQHGNIGFGKFRIKIFGLLEFQQQCSISI